MDIGTKISGTAHLALIGFAAFGSFFSADPAEPVSIAEVSLITSDELSARVSEAPAPEITAPEENIEQQTEELAMVQPEELSPSVETTPDVTPLVTPEQTPLETLDTSPPPIPENVISGQPSAEELANVRPVPRPADRIAQTEASAVENPTNSQDTTQATVADEQASEQVEQSEATAPEETTTAIVTEADEPRASAAPTKSLRPQTRPERPQVAQEQPEETPVEEVVEDTSAEDMAAEIAAAVAEAQAEAAAQEAQQLSGAEMQGLILAVQDCWIVPIGVQFADELVVVLGISFNEDGTLATMPRLIEQNGSGDVGLQAFESARSALISCQPYALPPEKFESWREMEVVFNPRDMVLR